MNAVGIPPETNGECNSVLQTRPAVVSVVKGPAVSAECFVPVRRIQVNVLEGDEDG
jgi:hypothetical protein